VARCAYCQKEIDGTDGGKWNWLHHPACWDARWGDAWRQAKIDGNAERMKQIETYMRKRGEMSES